MFKAIASEISDTWTITKRNLLRYVRLPRLLVFSSIQPIMFLVLFNYVFGGAVRIGAVPGGKYINFLLPGLLAQVVMFGAIQTGIGLADDMSRGIVDRFRSLPMSRAAVMAGRTLSDTIRNLVVIGIMIGVGSLMGFRFQHGALNAVGMIGVLLLYGFAFSWIAAVIGMASGDTETAQLAGFLMVFPLTFASAVFVPTQNMPGWLQAFANNQPVTHVVTAARELALGIPGNGAVWKIALWAIGILIVFVPLATNRYKRSV
ncbi:MAG TPA: ABC transporter permease [Candidatus Saccharimonadales bacterium]|nr:ABC transporter permease [Candidatus Saccharimonadales bacterium]